MRILLLIKNQNKYGFRTRLNYLQLCFSNGPIEFNLDFLWSQYGSDRPGDIIVDNFVPY